MEFNEKLQELRKQKGLTQEELAEDLFVSRTAISKWESGRGYPSIDSLKAIAKYFSVTIDELLSGDEVLSIAEEDNKQKQDHFRNLVFGLLDICTAVLLFLPLFAQRTDEVISGASLLSLTSISLYLKVAYFAFVALTIASGVLVLALQGSSKAVILRKISLIMNSVGLLVFILSLQPYASIFLLGFLIIKALMIVKRH